MLSSKKCRAERMNIFKKKAKVKNAAKSIRHLVAGQNSDFKTVMSSALNSQSLHV